MKTSGNLVDIHNRDIYPVIINFSDGKIESIKKIFKAPDVYIIPGLIDAHIHIESSMITPGAFAQAAVRHGTTGVVSDPHEIANVMGEVGIKYMMEDSKKVPVYFWFGASSCVPATDFETSGGKLKSTEIGRLLKNPEIKYLSEMMNFPGVIYGDSEVLKKIKFAQREKKPVDGHAPGLTGEMLERYVSAGITTDHECSSLDEALEKIALGMKILIREGSAARNLDSLSSLLSTHPEMVMLCCDDLHPEMLLKRHINKLIAKLIIEGYDIYDVIRSATLNPVRHYNLDAGLLKEGDNADFIVVDDPGKMNVLETWIRGEKVFAGGNVLFEYEPGKPINNFRSSPIIEHNIRIENKGNKIRVIEASEGELLTKELLYKTGNSEFLEADTGKDILIIVVKNRYTDLPPSLGFIRGFGLTKGAFASSIAHDSHNIIAVGTSNKDIADAINEIIKLKGGLSVAYNGNVDSLQLNIAGIMTTRSCEDVAGDYEKLNSLVKSMGCKMNAPFMTLSFMALLVIPDLKIGDKGLFDVKKFEFVSLFAQ